MKNESNEGQLPPNSGNHYELKETDLPAHCPMSSMSQWNSHPKVYLPIKENGGSATCPYCSAIYSLKK